MFFRAHTTLKMSVLLLTPTENCVDPRQCASTSTSQPAAGAVTAATRTYAAAAIPVPTSSPTALSNSPATPARPLSLANEARSKIQQLRLHQKPFVSSPIDIYSLKWYYDENRTFPIVAIFKHKMVACVRRKMLFTLFKYLFSFQRY